MAEKNPNHEWQMTDCNSLDRELNAELARYAAVEPRPGIEERILATLRSQKEPVPAHSWWRWGVAGALALAILPAAIGGWRSRPVHAPAIAAHSLTPPPIPTAATPARRAVQLADSRLHLQEPAAIRTAHRRSIRPKVEVVVGPKLDHFPSAQPLTQEELALARYVRQFPAEATLIAKAQEEYAQQAEQKMNVSNSGVEPSNLDQEER